MNTNVHNIKDKMTKAVKEDTANYGFIITMASVGLAITAYCLHIVASIVSYWFTD